jgi:hypothetical protein
MIKNNKGHKPKIDCKNQILVQPAEPKSHQPLRKSITKRKGPQVYRSCRFTFAFSIKKMKFRGRSSIAADDKVVSTATAKKEWFLKDLSGLATKKEGWNGPTVYAMKDLDRLALKVHGRDGLAKKKEARKKRLEKKSAKGKTKIGDAKATGRKKKREDGEEEEEKEKEEEEEVVSRKKRSNKDDNDFVPEERSKKMDDDLLVTSSGRQVSREQVMSGLKKRNQTMEGTWVFQDCDEADSDLVLKLSKDGKSMSGYCVITGCDVRLRCNDLFNLQDFMLDFGAVFKTQRVYFAGRMLIRLMEKGKALSISYSNGAPGQGAVSFNDVTARKRK